MKRLLHLGLLLLALTGLIGQSTAMAMAPLGISSARQAPLAAMTGGNCIDMPAIPATGKGPCKKLTLQCIAAMGCSPLVFTDPPTPVWAMVRTDLAKSANDFVPHLTGRTYGPEPDPPSLLT